VREIKDYRRKSWTLGHFNGGDFENKTTAGVDSRQRGGGSCGSIIDYVYWRLPSTPHQLLLLRLLTTARLCHRRVGRTLRQRPGPTGNWLDA